MSNYKVRTIDANGDLISENNLWLNNKAVVLIQHLPEDVSAEVGQILHDNLIKAIKGSSEEIGVLSVVHGTKVQILEIGEGF
jgi:hypothetical protein